MQNLRVRFFNGVEKKSHMGDHPSRNKIIKKVHPERQIYLKKKVVGALECAGVKKKVTETTMATRMGLETITTH